MSEYESLMDALNELDYKFNIQIQNNLIKELKSIERILYTSNHRVLRLIANIKHLLISHQIVKYEYEIKAYKFINDIKNQKNHPIKLSFFGW